jgi:hypothetical protein
MFLKKLIILSILLIFLVGPCSAVTDNPGTPTKIQFSIEKAILIAKLNIGAYGFGEYVPIESAVLTQDKKYWVIKAKMDQIPLKITVNVENGNSKLNNNASKSFSELKACYVAILNYPDTGKINGKLSIVTLENKKFWKVPIYDNAMKKLNYVYFDSTIIKLCII